MVVLIGENINIMSQTIGPALKGRDPKPIQELARQEDKAGIDYLDLNIGPARKSGEEMLVWAVKTVQEVTSKPLSLDTTNLVAMRAGLAAHKGRALINSISPAREEGLPLAQEFNADMIGLMWGKEGMPCDANERCVLCVDLVYKANALGIPNESIWIDPIVTPVSGEINQLKACIEFMSMLPEIAPGCRTTVGLSNVSNGTPAHLRPYLNRTYLIMLMKYGLYSAIVDAFDAELIKVAKGQMPEIVSLVHRVVDGEKPDMATLSQKEQQYVKTVRVLTGESLYSHSWLEI